MGLVKLSHIYKRENEIKKYPKGKIESVLKGENT